MATTAKIARDRKTRHRQSRQDAETAHAGIATGVSGADVRADFCANSNCAGSVSGNWRWRAKSPA